jgi:hypothetical protein
MIRPVIFILGVLLSICVDSFSQSTIAPEHSISIDLADRMDILYGSDMFTSNRNFVRKEIFGLAKQLSLSDNIYSARTNWDLSYLLNDNNEWFSESPESSDTMVLEYIDSTKLFYNRTKEIAGPKSLNKITRKPFLKYFYHTPANFYEVDKPGFIMKINPVINFNAGKADNNGNIIFQNTRGINIRAYIDEKVYVFTNILENQARFNDFHEGRIRKFNAIPGNGLYKSYDSGINNLTGWDFLNAQAYVGFQVSKNIGIELGHGRHHIGNGVRSLLLSNYAQNYFYLKFRTQVWKLHYQNIFAELAPISDRLNPGNTLLPKKYMANHYLAFKPNKNFEIGLFETVVFSRENHFELQYLNPVILYRAVEHFLDSPDNILLGLNSKWNIKNTFQLYGQLVLDELKISEFTSDSGWWGNKYGVQLGLKYINVAKIDHLDAQIEFNTVSPYTFSHRDTLSVNSDYAVASYSQYNQPLAHPLGSNFRELLVKMNYRPVEKLFVQSRVVLAAHGDDTSNENWGGNILTPHTTRVMDYGNEILQGERTDITLIGVDLSYSIFHNYFLDLNFLYRKSTSTLEVNNYNTTYIGGGLRINLGRRVIDY